MASIPQKLEDWNHDVVLDLVSKGYFETDTFEFKEFLTSLSDSQKHNDRLTTTACAFANTKGGFIVFGIKDDPMLKLGTSERVVGVDASTELAKQFGDKVSSAQPVLDFVVQNPPIRIPGTPRVILVVHIRRSQRGPHMNGEGKFYKRTNKGNESMSHSEIADAFLGYEERLARVKFLYMSLIDIQIRLEPIVRGAERGEQPGFLVPDATTIIPTMSAVYGLLLPLGDLPGLLLEIKREADAISAGISMLHQQRVLPLSNLQQIISSHNKWVLERGKGLQEMVDRALDILESQFEMRRKRQDKGDRIQFEVFGMR